MEMGGKTGVLSPDGDKQLPPTAACFPTCRPWGPPPALAFWGYRQDGGSGQRGREPQGDATELGCHKPRSATGSARPQFPHRRWWMKGKKWKKWEGGREMRRKGGGRGHRTWGEARARDKGVPVAVAGPLGSHEDAFALDAVCPLLFAGALAIDVQAHVPARLQREQLLEELLDVVVHLG